jgi:hypothetical protein
MLQILIRAVSSLRQIHRIGTQSLSGITVGQECGRGGEFLFIWCLSFWILLHNLRVYARQETILFLLSFCKMYNSEL